MCALVLCAFRECDRSGVVDGFAHGQRLRFYSIRKYVILHRISPKVAEFLKHERIFRVME